MDPVVIIGGGGHAKVVIELLEDAAQYQIAGCTVSGAEASFVLDIPVLGEDSELPRIYASGVRHAIVAVGGNRVRRTLAQMARNIGFQLISAVSPRAIVSKRAELSAGIAIMAGAVVNSCCRLGEGCIVNTGATVDHDCRIGDWAHIAPGTNLAGRVTVGEGAFLGIGSRVIPGITIGEWTTVGAGAVVVRDLPAAVTAVGVPARITGGAGR
jgi:UDP-perosamine 4-acetyltransferase